jgi:undecaprenyl phosphate-alpha-L-ara4FN deformylase
MFRAFVAKALAQGCTFSTLGKVLPDAGAIPSGAIARGSVAGRDGWVAVQEMNLLAGRKIHSAP